MFLRYASAICTLLYGVLLAYVLISWWHFGWYHFNDARWLEIVLAFVAGIAVLRGASTWWVFVTMSLILIGELVAYHGGTTVMIVLMLEGVWTYSKLDIFPLIRLLLEILAILLSLSADGRLQKSIRFLRYWPNHKEA